MGLDSIKALTLEGVTEDRITLSWNLLRTEEGVVDPTIGYTVYVETNDGGDGKVFMKDPNTETVYTLNPNSGGGTPLPLDDTGNRADGVEVTDLNNNTPYRIVVEARDTLGNTVQSRLLAYTASEWGNTDISGVEITTESKGIVVTWATKTGAQGYAIKGTVSENQFGGDTTTEDIIVVVCPPGSLLCESDGLATEEGGNLQYTIPVNQEGVRYDLVIVPFNFRDLVGLQAVDEEGLAKTFIEEVLVQTGDETSVLSIRLKAALENNAPKFKIEVDKAGPPVDLVLESTGNTLSANWEHGEGADFYYAFITSNGGVNAVTNIIDRYEPSGRFAGGGYTSFSDLTANTSYTVTVQSFTVITNVTNVGGEVSATLSTKDAEETLEAPGKVTADDLILTNHEAGKLRVVWSTSEANSVVGYNVFYWVGDTAPNKPQYVAAKGETNLVFTVDPGNYKVRVDVLSTYPGQEVVTGDTGSIVVYDKPSKPMDLGVVFSRGSFTEIENKIYATRYPLTYTGADTSAQAGGPVEDVSYLYRYRVAGGDWSSYVNIEGATVIELLVDDLGNADVVKSGYGKKYQVELVASNEGGFVSDPGILKFTYKSFPEPFMQKENLKVIAGDRSLTVTWPNIAEKNGSTVADYTVALSDDPYGLPLQVTNVVNRKVVFEGLVNNHSYLITVIPNDRVTGNILTALSLVTGYTIGAPIARGSDEERILAAYTGVPDFYTPQGTPEAVVSLAVTPGEDLATVTWEASTEGSPASKYVLEYLVDVTTPLITNVYISGDAADAELSGLSWAGAVSVEVETNETGSYSEVVNDLNVSSATNVFRVRPVRIDDSGKEWLGEYRYYALGAGTMAEFEPTPPSEVRDLKVDSFTANQVVLSWIAPTNTGTYRTTTATLSGYVVKYKKTADSEFIEIDETGEGVRLATALTGTSTNATVTGLDANTSYTFLVVAINSGNAVGLDTAAPTISQTTVVAAPSNLRKIQLCNKTTSVELAWDATSGATSYKLYRNSVTITNTDATTYTDTDRLNAGTKYTYTVQACSTNGCSGDSDPLTITTLSGKSFESIIEIGRTPADLTGYDERSREIFSRYSSDVLIEAKYLKPGGSGDGSSFANAEGNLKDVLDGITDAAADKVYAVFLTGGEYKAGEAMAMKNHVAIIGGVDECLGSSDTVTALNGEGSYRVFNNNNGLDDTALLYGVTVTNGNNDHSGGGMVNNQSSPSLVRVTFSGNHGKWYGGGMYNFNNSSPTLVGVTFSGNSAEYYGGGIFNRVSSPSLVGVTFSGNSAGYYGGGMYNSSSSPSLVGVTFFENYAGFLGGAIGNNNDDQVGPLIINSIFWENTSTTNGYIQHFYFFNSNNQEIPGNSDDQENLGIYNSIVQGGTGNLESGIASNSIRQVGFFSDGGSAPVVISFANIIINDPGLGDLADNGGSVLTHAIPSDSPAVNQGLYVRKAGSTFYYSADNTVWYTEPDLSGTVATVPEDAEDITATDATGHTRAGRPDLGAYEAR